MLTFKRQSSLLMPSIGSRCDLALVMVIDIIITGIMNSKLSAYMTIHDRPLIGVSGLSLFKHMESYFELVSVSKVAIKLTTNAVIL